MALNEHSNLDRVMHTDATTVVLDNSQDAAEARAESSFGRFFLPGPTEVRPEILAAMSRPVIGHRGQAMVDLLRSVDTPLRELFRTERPVYVSTSSATGFMEAAITNLSRRRILCLIAGAFAERFHKIADKCGRPADRVDIEWGGTFSGDRLRELLSADPDRYDLVTVVHSETSTGALNPVAELAGVAREFDDVLLAVDGVTSVGGAQVEFDEWGLDFLLTGSQKAMALPPGLAFAAASPRALERATQVPARSFYFDLLEFEARAPTFQTTNTPAVSLIYALQAQMARFAEEGVEARWARHMEMAERTWAWTDEMTERFGRPFSVLAAPGFRSPTVTTIKLPPGVSGPGVTAAAAVRGYTIAPGYGSLKPTTIRIGHMGDHSVSELETLLGVLAVELRTLIEGP